LSALSAFTAVRNMALGCGVLSMACVQAPLAWRKSVTNLHGPSPAPEPVGRDEPGRPDGDEILEPTGCRDRDGLRERDGPGNG
jgi:hypothetical protein